MKRRSVAFWLWWIGGILAVAGIGVAVASVLRDSSRVADFARVPAGCASTIEISEKGRYYLYSENLAEVPEIGSCSNDGRSVDLERAPEVSIEVTDESGEFVDLLPSGDASYSLPDHEGRSVARVDLQAGETYVVEVSSDNDQAVVAIGPRLVPEEQPLLVAGAVIVLVSIVVLVVAFVFTMRGRRRRTMPPFPDEWGQRTTPDGSMADGNTWLPPTADDRVG